MNAAAYVNGVLTNLASRGFQQVAVPADLTEPVAGAMQRQGELGRLLLVLLDPAAAGAAGLRESLVSAMVAWNREQQRQGEDPCYLLLVFPFLGGVSDDESARIRVLAEMDPNQQWGVIPWVVDLSVGLVDQHRGFPKIADDVARVLTDVEYGRPDGLYPQAQAPRPSRPRGFAVNVGNFPTSRLILALTIAYYLWVAMMSGSTFSALFGGPSSSALVKWGADYSGAVFAGEQWRYLTYMLLHAGVLHIGLNMWAFWEVGRYTEVLFGSRRAAFIYVVAGVVGGIASAVFRIDTVLTVGASGAIMGQMGALAYVALAMPGRAINWRAVMLPVAINLAFGFMVPGIDNFAHIGGFIGGVAAAFLAGVPGERAPWRTVAMAATLAVIGLILAGVVQVPHLGMF